MKNVYVAVDIGASSGRLMLAKVNSNQQIQLEEIHRFKNGFKKPMVMIDGILTI